MITRITVVTPTETRALEPRSVNHQLEYDFSSYGNYAILIVTEENSNEETTAQFIFKEWNTLTVTTDSL